MSDGKHKGPKRKGPKKINEVQAQSEPSSGNVFADLGIRNPDVALAKAELVQRIRDLIAGRNLTQARAGQLLGLDQPKVSALVRGRVGGYSIDRLFRFLNALGQQVEIRVRPRETPARTEERRSIRVTH